MPRGEKLRNDQEASADGEVLVAEVEPLKAKKKRRRKPSVEKKISDEGLLAQQQEAEARKQLEIFDLQASAGKLIDKFTSSEDYIKTREAVLESLEEQIESHETLWGQTKEQFADAWNQVKYAFSFGYSKNRHAKGGVLAQKKELVRGTMRSTERIIRDIKNDYGTIAAKLKQLGVDVDPIEEASKARRQAIVEKKAAEKNPPPAIPEATLAPPTPSGPDVKIFDSNSVDAKKVVPQELPEHDSGYTKDELENIDLSLDTEDETVEDNAEATTKLEKGSQQTKLGGQKPKVTQQDSEPLESGYTAKELEDIDLSLDPDEGDGTDEKLNKELEGAFNEEQKTLAEQEKQYEGAYDQHAKDLQEKSKAEQELAKAFEDEQKQVVDQEAQYQGAYDKYAKDLQDKEQLEKELGKAFDEEQEGLKEQESRYERSYDQYAQNLVEQDKRQKEILEKLKDVKNLGELYELLEQTDVMRDGNDQYPIEKLIDDIRILSGEVSTALEAEKPVEQILVMLNPEELQHIPEIGGLQEKVIELIKRGVESELPEASLVEEEISKKQGRSVLQGVKNVFAVSGGIGLMGLGALGYKIYDWLGKFAKFAFKFTFDLMAGKDVDIEKYFEIFSDKKKTPNKSE